ncbi:MAG TPA: regulatory protein RecX [Dehalococcoidia bacterium]|nr:regulatory protein RecX [Dehalococcoidia bacterium]
MRSRSREELRRRLLRKGLDGAAVDHELARLQEQGYIDDDAFARAWVAVRQGGSVPRGAAMLTAELLRKGVDREVTRDAVAAGDDSTAAGIAARKRATALAARPYGEFRRRLFAFLQRRGFGYDVSRLAVDQAWQDLTGASAPPTDEAEPK